MLGNTTEQAVRIIHDDATCESRDTGVRDIFDSGVRDILDSAVRAIRDSYATLRGTKNLSPQNESVTGSLTHLVRTLTEHSQSSEVTQYLLGTPDLAAERAYLPELCGMAECEMEKYWARHLIAQDKADLSDFWYYPEYCALFESEIALLGGKAFHRVSFLGAGALPVTAFLLARHWTGGKIVCVDMDPEACELSRQLIAKLGLSDAIEIRCMDALTYQPEENELIICASLLQGGDTVYQRLQNISCSLMVRDAEGAYQFLYKPAQLPKKGFRKIAKTIPNAKRINTTHYYEQSPEAAA